MCYVKKTRATKKIEKKEIGRKGVLINKKKKRLFRSGTFFFFMY